MIDPVDAIISLHIAMVVWLLFRFPGMLLMARERRDEQADQPQHDEQLDEGRLKHPSNAA